MKQKMKLMYRIRSTVVTINATLLQIQCILQTLRLKKG